LKPSSDSLPHQVITVSHEWTGMVAARSSTAASPGRQAAAGRPAQPGRPGSPARPAQPDRARSSRLSLPVLVAIGAIVALAIVFATDQVLPATSTHQAQLRVWLGSRAAGLVALMLLTFQVVVGLVLSHPTNKSTWRLSKLLFPWHEHAWVFTLAFVIVHGVTIAIDEYAKVGWIGALIPGLSEYRTVPVALGTIALYALFITGITARITKLLPAGWWLKLHRLSLGVLMLGWVHGMLAGTDTFDAALVYGVSFAAVALAAAYRYWIVRAARPTFATSLREGEGA
jgi:sulfoxide reductase heme-binding subunit YedZ